MRVIGGDTYKGEDGGFDAQEAMGGQPGGGRGDWGEGGG